MVWNPVTGGISKKDSTSSTQPYGGDSTFNPILGGKDNDITTDDDNYADNNNTPGSQEDQVWNPVVGGRDDNSATTGDNPGEAIAPENKKKVENVADAALGSIDESFGRQFDSTPGGGWFDADTYGSAYQDAAGILDKAAGKTDEAVGRQFDKKKGGGFADMFGGFLDKYKYYIIGAGGLLALGLGYPYIQTISGVTGE